MNKKLTLQDTKCTRCSRLLEIAKTQSKPKDGLVVGYCKNKTHRIIKFRIMLQKGLERTIRSNRMKTTKNDDQDFHLRSLKCPLCGKKLAFAKKGSYQGGGKIQYFCYNNEKHRLQIVVYAKLISEPDFQELQEIQIGTTE